MENILKAYSELCESMKRFTEAMENAKLKLSYDIYDDYEEGAMTRSLVHNSLELSPFFHPSIDEIVDKTLSTLHDCKDANAYLSPDSPHRSEPTIPTRDDVYRIILAYFGNNPILMNYVSGVVNHAGEYHTCHWYTTFNSIMDCDIYDVIKVKLVDYIIESGDIIVNDYKLEKSYVGRNTIKQLVERLYRINNE